ncbi:MAG TPA: TIGR04222 domain-containing membrane protein, partial [Pilimelia sp.]|nr:TIGR04222 domain-containing membrane protein [Pilimelia sp.]
MIGYAAAGDTWGIPGPTFLLVFVSAAAAITVGAMVHRRILFAGPRDVPLTELGPQQAAYLNGGERLAVYSSVGALRTAGSIGTTPDGALLAQTGSMPAGVTPLDQAVYNAAGSQVRPKSLTRHPWVRAALDQLRHSLEQSGLALNPHVRQAARYGPLLLLALLTVGMARVVAGVSNDKPV